MNKTVSTIGRIVFALPMAIFGVGHLMNAPMMATMVPKWMPAPEILVYFSGVALILAAISLIINKFTHLAGLGLAAFMLVMVLTVQLPGMSNPDSMMKQMAFAGFMKDTALLGAGLMVFGWYNPKNA